MATISSPGVGSGLDVNSIVTSLVKAERAPLDLLATREEKLQSQVSALGRLKSALSTFESAARALSQVETWTGAKASSSSADDIGVTAAAGAPVSSYGLSVQQLAQRASAASAPLGAATTVIGGGTLSFAMGSVNGNGAFVADGARTPVSVSIAATDTLAQVRDKVNAAGAGVTASLVTDAGGTRLLFRSAETGAAQAFRVDVSDADGNGTDAAGLSRLQFDPSTGATPRMQVMQQAADARFTVDGLQLTTTGNRAENVLPGLTLDLKRVTTGTVSIETKQDTGIVGEKVKAFVTAYNAVMTTLAEQTKYDAATKTAGALQGNGTIVGVRNQLRDMMSRTVGGVAAGDPARLADIGLDIKVDGSIVVNQSKLDAALATPDKLRTLFNRDDANASGTGLAFRLTTLTTSILGAEGSLTAASDAFSRRQQDIDAQQEAGERRIAAFQERLLKQYQALDATLAGMQQFTYKAPT